jgi:glucose-6-phosphate 1-dehydrogenase
MTHLVILGAGGDLTSRYLIPALAELDDAGVLPAGITITGVGRQPWDDESFRQHLAGCAAASPLLSRLHYHRGDVTDAATLRAALGDRDAPAVAYLALPPHVFPGAVQALGAAPLAAGSRIVIEKPFGSDLGSARQLNALVHEVVPEDAVFRVDHFLGMQTVQNILGLRFANRIFEAAWNAQHIESVDIIWDETLGLEGRAGYYDAAGALRDMIQNHLLQLLCLLAMEPPVTLTERALRDRKVDVLRSIRRPSLGEIRRDTVRARYRAGNAGGTEVPDYADEAGVDPQRGTETFAAVTLHVDNWRWAGVPFTLRSGKALDADHREVRVRFRPVPHLPFDQDHEPEPNLLRLRMDPDQLALEVNVNGAGDPFQLERAGMTADLAPQALSAYARLLLDIFDGDPILSIRADEAEEAWRVIEPIIDAWTQGATPLAEYGAGTSGPGPSPAPASSPTATTSTTSTSVTSRDPWSGAAPPEQQLRRRRTC